ncbi:hypothetical protein QM012_001190 [Aureobasidium pullulans]|uniref:Apple domain-containing protein n=1 Tax=Aureobasidium pullulans TaxID=5580 RepID=A0ABR0TG05_AURPU
MKSGLALAALAFSGMSLAQSTTAIATSAVDIDGQTTTLVSNIDPSDIAALPEPEVLGPPVGVYESVSSATYNEAQATASVLALVVEATDAQTAVITPESTAIAATKTPIPVSSESAAARKRSYVGGLTGNVQRRDLSYPIDTSNYHVPSGYTPAFVNLQGSTQANGYLTYKTLSSYDPQQCTAACDKISSCQFANIYYEKDPDSNNNPVDVIKCALYSMPQTNCTATNKGQWRGSFHVLVTGSNGYNKAAAPKTPAGYSLQSLPAAVNAPVYDDVGQWRFIQPVYLNSYDPALCAAACDKQTAWDKSQATDDCNYKTCVYANMYILSQDGIPKTVVCALYTEVTDPSYATNYGYSTDTDSFQVSNSIALTNTTAVSAGYPQLCAASSGDISYLNSTGAAFCTSYLGYVAPTKTVKTTVTPGATTVFATVTKEVTVTSVYSTETVSVTGAAANGKRGASVNIITTTVELPFITVSGNETLVDYMTSTLTVNAASTSGAVITPASVDPAASAAALAKRSAIPTPSSILHWPSAKISSACSQIATGTVTSTQTVTASGSAVTNGATVSATTITSIVSTVTITVGGSSPSTSSSSAPSSTAVPGCPKTVGTQGQLSLGGYSLGFPTPITFNSDPLFWTPLGGFGDEFVYDTTGDFLYHVDTGYCLTLGAATSTQSPKYVGSPFTLSACSCSTKTTVTQSFTFNQLKVKSGKAKKSCLAIKGDNNGSKSYYPKLVDTGDDEYPFSAVYAGTKLDACITFEADS